MKTLKRIATIAKKNKENNKYVNKDLYRLLYSEELYIAAYEKIKSNTLDPNKGRSLEGFSLNDVKKIIQEIKNESFKFKAATRIYIPKPGKKEKRPIDIGNIRDKIVLEAIRIILETIFEPRFLETSHGFRPNKGCHSALRDVRVMFRGTKWFIEGDISKYFNTIDHEILITLLKNKIEDVRFLNIIRKVLNAGYLEFNIHKTDMIGVPQGNIISPILANIYLHELDKFMESLINIVTKGNKRKPLKEYVKIQGEITKSKNKQEFSKVKELKKTLLRTKTFDFNDPEYKRLNYVRYADDFLIGIVGSKKEAIEIKEKIKEFLNNNLKLNLNEEKTLITNASKEEASFLGTHIKCPIYEEEKIILRERNGIISKQRKSSANIRINMNVDKIIQKLKNAKFCNGAGKSIPKYT